MPPHSHSGGPERGLLRWSGALAVTLALHGGAVAAGLMQWNDAPPPILPAAAIMLELAPAPAAPANPTLATPEWRRPDPLPTPRAAPEAAAAAEDSSPSLVNPKATPPEPLPTPAAAKPVVEPPKAKPKTAEPQKLAATEKPANKEKPAKKEKLAAKPIPAALQSQPAPQAMPAPALAAAASAPPAKPVQQAAIAAAPSAAELARRAAAQANWQGLLLAHLERHKNYPRAARKRLQQGTSLLRFRMDRSGRVLSYALAKSSGYEALDAEVLAMIERAQPLPPLPAEISDAVVEIVVPVQFTLR